MEYTIRNIDSIGEQEKIISDENVLDLWSFKDRNSIFIPVKIQKCRQFLMQRFSNHIFCFVTPRLKKVSGLIKKQTSL